MQNKFADLIIISKEEYLKQIKEYPLYDAHTLIEFAKLTNNNKLLQAVKSQYQEEFEAENNE